MIPTFSLARLAVYAAIVIAVFGAGCGVGAHWVQGEWDADSLRREQAKANAILEREKENAALLAKHEDEKKALVKETKDEVAKIRRAYDAALASGLRFKVGSGGLTSTSDPKGTCGVDAGATIELPRTVTEGLLGIARDCEVTATNYKALQTWIRMNGME